MISNAVLDIKHQTARVVQARTKGDDCLILPVLAVEWLYIGKIEGTMGFKRGERQSQRTRKALEDAFKELLGEQSYHTLTVEGIADRANVGRSTFYRYYQSKADVLVSLHEGNFDRFRLELSSAADWLSDQPPQQLVKMLEKLEQRGDLSMPSAYQRMNQDADYLQRSIRKLFSEQLEKSLKQSFSEEESSIPFSVIAESISGVYTRLISSWMTSEPRTTSANNMAIYIHRLARSSIREALELPD